MDEIEDYEPRETQVVGVGEGLVEVFFEERLPEVGRAVVLESGRGDRAYAMVRRHLGGRKIEAAMPEVADWIEPGVAASTTGRRAGFRLDDDHLRLGADTLIPEPDEGELPTDEWYPADWRRPEFSELTADHPSLETGFSSLDTISPLARGGLNLLIDRSDQDDSFESIAEGLHRDLAEAEAIWVLAAADQSTPDWADIVIEPAPRAYGRMFALRAAIALASERRDRGRESFVVASLPAVGRTVASEDDISTTPGYGELVDRIGSALVSTDAAAITTLLRLPIPARQADIAPIVETLGLGDVDAQIFIDEQGRFAPRRSSSDATLDDTHRNRRADAMATLRRADDARERAKLLGERELSDEQHSALKKEDKLREKLL